MNRKLKRQIKAYAGVAGAILSAEKLNAQVIYVDINPDTLVGTLPCVSTVPQVFNLDVDGDAVNDFNFIVMDKTWGCTSFWGSTKGYIKVEPLNGNKINNGYYWAFSYFQQTYLSLVPRKLSQNDTINFNGSWLNNPGNLWFEREWYDSAHGHIGRYNGAWDPPFPSAGCLPFLLYKNSNNYYGWMRIEVLTRGSFLLKGYAYQTQPNVPILACDTANLATIIPETNPQFNFSQQNNSIHISTFQNLNHANICVYDLLGKEILQQPFEGKEATVTINKKGIYFVEMKSEKGVFRKKVFIY